MMTTPSTGPELKVLRSQDLRSEVAVVLGTRPGIIKQSPLIRTLSSRGVPFFVIHTGQHYSYELDRKLFEDLELPDPDFHLGSMAQYSSHGQQTAEMLKGVEAALLERRPTVVLVGGDANTNLAAALAARKLHIAVGHVEAGLRSFDWRMPEEHNRVIIDHISEYLFAPTEIARRNMEREGVRGQIHVVGNTIVEAVRQHYSLALQKSSVLERCGCSPKQYIFMTVHREENTDYVENLSRVLEGIRLVVGTLGLPVVFAAHPRTTRRLAQFGLEATAAAIPGLRLIDPLGYLDALRMMGSAALVMTDSGGVQQEACLLGVPCVTLRDTTEWVETVEVGANMVAGVEPLQVVEAARQMVGRAPDWPQLFGDGTTSEKITTIVQEALQHGVFFTPLLGGING